MDPARGQTLDAYMEGRLTADDEAAFEEHYFACATCLEAIRIRQALPAALETVPSHVHQPARWQAEFLRPGRIYFGLAVAATIALLLAYPAFLGLIRLPSATDEARALADDNARLRAELDRTRDTLEQELADLRESSEWTGAVPLVVLAPPLRRGASHEKIFSIPADHPYVSLAVVPSMPDHAADSDPFRFELYGKDGGLAWAIEMPASEIRRAVRNATVVMFLVPSATLPSGAYELLLRALGLQDAEPLLVIRFRLDRPHQAVPYTPEPR